MVAEDAERVRSQCAGRHVEDARQHFAGDFVHIGNHQQQALRCGERGGQRTSLQRTVQCTGGTAFRLHFLYGNVLSPKILATASGPLINVLRHRRRRCDGVDGGYFREHIAHVSCSLVTITSDKFLFFCHLSNVYVRIIKICSLSQCLEVLLNQVQILPDRKNSSLIRNLFRETSIAFRLPICSLCCIGRRCQIPNII